MIEGKIWGSTELLLKESVIEIHRLEIVPGGYCSMHHHDYKWNCFVVLSGELVIQVKKNTYDLVDETLLRAGQVTTVCPDEEHMFINRGDVAAVALEIYYPQMLGGADIVRTGVGGVEKRDAVSPPQTVFHHPV